MQQVIQCLAEPRRLQILGMLRDHELSAGEIARRFRGTRQAISHHLQVLERAELVRVRPEGRRRLYRANPEGLAELKDFLDTFWTRKLASLKQAVESAGEAEEHG